MYKINKLIIIIIKPSGKKLSSQGTKPPLFISLRGRAALTVPKLGDTLKRGRLESAGAGGKPLSEARQREKLKQPAGARSGLSSRRGGRGRGCALPARNVSRQERAHLADSGRSAVPGGVRAAELGD